MRYINANGDVESKYILKLYDYFYHKEHLFIVTELLKDNLYDFYKHINDKGLEPYFTLNKLQIITKQILTGLEFLQSLKLIHSDLKPENILMKSITNNIVKIIDFGSSCFIHDHLSNYMQSRSYRAPEVILDVPYNYKVDIWSLGCILAELWTGNVLFQNDSIQSYLARIMGICGPLPEYMFKGKIANTYFSKEKLLFIEIEDNANQSNIEGDSNVGKKKMHIIIPKKSNIRNRLKANDDLFVDFIKNLLEVDHTKRPTASEALKHAWLSKDYSD